MRVELILSVSLHRLWHQLTQHILDFFKQAESGPFKVNVYQQFVAEWENKINRLSLVTIALQAASQCQGKVEAKVKRL